MKNVVGLILGGGKGTRLFPLTEQRSKPAVPLGAKYRLIDIPISNCINSGVDRIYLVTQFNSVSLHSHIRQTYSFDRFHGGFVEILAAQQTTEGADWYQGTADAVRKNLRYIEQSEIEYVLILSGDQLYRMDYSEMLATHIKHKADVTIAGLPVDRQSAKEFGIMRLDDSGRLKGFLEKPKTEQEIEMVRTDPKWIDERGIESKGRDCLASMGLYIFNKNVLVDLLRKSDYQDFGKEVFPMAIRTRHVQVHLFDGYWEDIGTIKAFYESNLDLTSPTPQFVFNLPGAPMFTQARFLPPTHVENARISRSLVADGCFIDEGSEIENCIIGLRARIGKNVKIRNSIIMGNDYFHFEQPPGHPDVPLGIGDGCHIEGSIIDKNCHMAPEITVIGRPDLDITDEQPPVYIRDGIAVTPKGAILPPGWRMRVYG
jgi:glucose-1-phosphate adenylyltransferase